MADLVKISLLGAMPGGEEWSINPVWRINAAPQDVSYAEALAIATAVAAISPPLSVRAMWNTTTTFTGCRVEARTNEGVLESLAESIRATPIVGTGTIGHPFQTAAVVSLRTPLAGPSGRGRLFVPATGIDITPSTLRLSAGVAAGVATAMRTWLTDIQAAVTVSVPDVILAVWSRKLNTTLGVTRMLVGDVLDVQRRRRDAAVESYSQLSYPT